MWHANLPHLPCLLAKMWCVRGITIKCNVDFCKIVPTFSAAQPAVQPRRATIAFLIVRIGCQKCFGVTGGTPQVNSQRSALFGLLITVSLQANSKALQGRSSSHRR